LSASRREQTPVSLMYLLSLTEGGSHERRRVAITGSLSEYFA